MSPSKWRTFFQLKSEEEAERFHGWQGLGPPWLRGAGMGEGVSASSRSWQPARKGDPQSYTSQN